uniref:Uncharacterized protein n=1 Tax=viral metagenome TaxID=1070528 RepID=A0A6M3LTR8_9ZZZZ
MTYARDSDIGSMTDTLEFERPEIDDSRREQIQQAIEQLTEFSDDIVYSAPATANVTVASTVIAVENTKRTFLSIVNNSDATIYIGIGAPAVVGSGTRINGDGGSVTFIRGQNLTTQAINGIHAAAGNKAVSVQEGE